MTPPLYVANVGWACLWVITRAWFEITVRCQRRRDEEVTAGSAHADHASCCSAGRCQLYAGQCWLVAGVFAGAWGASAGWRWVTYQSPVGVLWLGVVIGFCSALGIIWVHLALGLNWSPFVEVQESHDVADTGPYAFVRHPMYTDFLLGALAICIWAQNTLYWPAFLGWWLIIGYARAPREEALLLETLGAPYAAYLKRVPDRFLPGDHRCRETAASTSGSEPLL